MAVWIHGSLDSWQFGFMAIHETTHPPATCGLPKSKCFLCIDSLIVRGGDLKDGILRSIIF